MNELIVSGEHGGIHAVGFREHEEEKVVTIGLDERD